MYTQCPHCQTCFRIAEDHLKIANGKVRCGSCQEVFDATQRLFKNLTDREPITFTPAKPKPRQTPPAKPAPPPPPASANTGKIDLNRATTPSPQAVEKILHERQKAPDQTPFMESTMGNDRYNNLDQMKSIDIPGQIDFGKSIIQVPDEEDNPAGKETASPTESGLTPPAQTKTPAAQPSAPSPSSRTIYEDLDGKEEPVTEAEQATLENFFADVDAQLHETDDNKSQLDKDIDELLAFAKGVDSPPAPSEEPAPDEPEIDISAPADTDGIEVSETFDMQAIADFEKELEASNPDVFSRSDKENAAAQAELDDALEGKEAVTHETTPAAADEMSSAITDKPAVSAGDETVPANETAQEELGEDDVPRALRSSLHMLNQGQRRSPGKIALMSLLILLLLGGLGFQVVLFRNVQLAQKFPQFIPELTQFCSRLPCRYSGKVDVSQIKLLNRDVRSDPSQPNALLISATFVDKAPFDQPYPIIKITLYDLGGNVVASRRFTPQEYLQKMYNRFLLMESGTPVHITLAVLDPGKDAINFEFKFL